MILIFRGLTKGIRFSSDIELLMAFLKIYKFLLGTFLYKATTLNHCLFQTGMVSEGIELNESCQNNLSLVEFTTSIAEVVAKLEREINLKDSL